MPDESSPEYRLPEDHWPLPELSTVEPHPHPPMSAYVRMQRSDDFQGLRRSFRTFAFPVVVAVLAWYFLYVLLSTFAEEFMGAPLVGTLTNGMIIGLIQFPTTWFATWLYMRRTATVLDPQAAELRQRVEAEVGA
ncbi:DUF485 domain-containing protein [Propionicicella superfundia]|uniref:DUF485 domain-containing protein n=1 Tax=Propionicicella superfundia TaxID=348582 RepID=UPI0003FFA1C5|nr:DUF485 domain-containing protein [Propionicicella superfundia]